MKFYHTNTKFTFGKHKNKTLAQIYKSQPGYVDWCLRKLDHFAIDWDTFNQLKKIQPKWFLSKEARNAIMTHVDKNFTTSNHEHFDDFSNQEFNRWRKNQHPVLCDRSDSDAERIMDLADIIGCDPEDLTANLDM